MSRTTRRGIFASALALGAALTGLFTSTLFNTTASAASISYGNVGPVPPGFTFLSVTESSGTDPVPLYGPPIPLGGLDFLPVNFVASANNGGADITDGQLNFSVQAAPGLFITGLSLGELGDYTLVGGGPASQVFAGAVILASASQINGVNVAPIILPASNASVNFNAVANPGAAQSWSLATSVAVPAALGMVTRIDVAINNSLVALSESGSIASIAKRAFTIDVHTEVPEPGAILLAGLGACGLVVAACHRKKR